MNNELFNKSYLKSGDIIVRDNDTVAIICKEIDGYITKEGGYPLNEYNDDLTNKNFSCLDIVAVFRPLTPFQCSFNFCEFQDGKLLFDKYDAFF